MTGSRRPRARAPERVYTWTITRDQADAAHAWVRCLARAHRDDQRYLAIMANGDVGAVPLVRCTACASPTGMSFSAAYQHLTLARHAPVPRTCVLVIDLTGIEVTG